MRGSQFTFFIPTSLAFVLSACLPFRSDIPVSVQYASPDDFLRSTLNLLGPTSSAGSSTITLRVRMEHSDGRFVVGFRPEYQVNPSVGFTLEPCSVSDSSGTAECRISTSTTGAGVVTFTKGPVQISASLNLRATVSGALLSVAALSGFTQDTDGTDKVSLVVGEIDAVRRADTNGSDKLSIGTTPILSEL